MSFAERLRLAILFWFVLTIVAGQEIVLVIWLAERLGKEVRCSQFTQPKVRLTFTILFTSLVICALYAAFIEPNWLEVTEVKLSTTKLTEGKQITIVQLSDLHRTRAIGKAIATNCQPLSTRNYLPDGRLLE